MVSSGRAVPLPWRPGLLAAGGPSPATCSRAFVTVGAIQPISHGLYPPLSSGTLSPRPAAAEAVLLGPGLGGEGLTTLASLSGGMKRPLGRMTTCCFPTDPCSCPLILGSLPAPSPGRSWGCVPPGAWVQDLRPAAPDRLGSSSSLQITGFWREVGVASNQNLALKTPRRLEALFLTWSGDQLTVKAAYSRQGGWGSQELGWEQPGCTACGCGIWTLSSLGGPTSLCKLPRTFTSPPPQLRPDPRAPRAARHRPAPRAVCSPTCEQRFLRKPLHFTGKGKWA